MTAPRLELRLDAIGRNARTLVRDLGARGLTVTGVTKAAVGLPVIARTLSAAGIATLGESRVDGVEALRAAGVDGPLAMIRSPQRSQVDRVVAHAQISFLSEVAVAEALSSAARRRGRRHDVVVMVELGDLREGVPADQLIAVTRAVTRLPGVRLQGLGTNLACRSGVIPDARKMRELSDLVGLVEVACDRALPVVSGGNSANLDWALSDAPVGRITELRLGEALLLGRETLHRRALPGLDTEAFTVVAEVIESRHKPSVPWGDTAQTAFGPATAAIDQGTVAQTIVALGEQDVDPWGLTPPIGCTVVGASSDHLVLTGPTTFPIGTELRFAPNYSALLRAMTSPTIPTVEVATPVPVGRG